MEHILHTDLVQTVSAPGTIGMYVAVKTYSISQEPPRQFSWSFVITLTSYIRLECFPKSLCHSHLTLFKFFSHCTYWLGLHDSYHSRTYTFFSRAQIIRIQIHFITRTKVDHQFWSELRSSASWLMSLTFARKVFLCSLSFPSREICYGPSPQEGHSLQGLGAWHVHAQIDVCRVEKSSLNSERDFTGKRINGVNCHCTRATTSQTQYKLICRHTSTGDQLYCYTRCAFHQKFRANSFYTCKCTQAHPGMHALA